MNGDEFEELAQEAADETGVTYLDALEVIQFLQDNDLLEQASVYNRYEGVIRGQ